MKFACHALLCGIACSWAAGEVHAAFSLHKAGKYTLRLTILDQMAGAKAQLELPLEVLDPSEPSTVAAK